jgi:integration host factor subunit beta
MTRSDLIDILARQQPHLTVDQIERAVKRLFEAMSHALAKGQRIEIRGFGSFVLRYRLPRMARNPKTGAYLQTTGKYVLHFKPGKDLKERVNKGDQFENNHETN